MFMILLLLELHIDNDFHWQFFIPNLVIIKYWCFRKKNQTHSLNFHSNRNRRRIWLDDRPSGWNGSAYISWNVRYRRQTGTGSSLASNTRLGTHSTIVLWFPNETRHPAGYFCTVGMPCRASVRPRIGVTLTCCPRTRCPWL